MIGEAERQTLGESKTMNRHRQQHKAPVRADPSPIGSGCDFLAGDRWKRQRPEGIVGESRRGWCEVPKRTGLRNPTLRQMRA